MMSDADNAVLRLPSQHDMIEGESSAALQAAPPDSIYTWKDSFVEEEEEEELRCGMCSALLEHSGGFIVACVGILVLAGIAVAFVLLQSSKDNSWLTPYPPLIDGDPEPIDSGLKVFFSENQLGREPATYFTATATAQGGTYSPVSQQGRSSPITISGLTNGVPYSVTISATNSHGESPSCLPSPEVAPHAPLPTPTPTPTPTGSGSGHPKMQMHWPTRTTDHGG